MKLFIQIPCFNEAQTLHRVVSDIPASLPGIDSIETVVIDDGSDDGTAAVALALGVDYVVRHNRNRGLAAAFATGVNSCLALGADIIVNTDGDHQYPGRSIESLVAPIIAGQADVVVGDRHPGTDRKFSWTRRFWQRLGRRVVSGLAGSDLADPVSGFRAFSRDAAQRIHIVTGYTYTVESLLQAVHKGLAVEFVSVDTNPPTRPSRLFRSPLQFLIRSGVTMLRVFFIFRPLSILLCLSSGLLLVGLMPIVRFVFLFLAGRGDGHSQSLILGAALVVLAGLILVAGLIADLVAHNRRLLEITLERLQRMEDAGLRLPCEAANGLKSDD